MSGTGPIDRSKKIPNLEEEMLRDHSELENVDLIGMAAKDVWNSSARLRSTKPLSGRVSKRHVNAHKSVMVSIKAFRKGRFSF